jgi:hypothetical protein
VISWQPLAISALRDTTAQWNLLACIVARRIRTAGFAAWWAENRADYSHAFASWIDAISRDVAPAVGASAAGAFAGGVL